jgi:predicted DNA-binding transcriptional regulator AlpA
MTARTLAEIDADAGSAVATVPRLLDADRIAELLQVTRRHVNHLVHIGEFPAPVLVGGSQRRWLASDYNAYVAKLREKQAKRRRHA